MFIKRLTAILLTASVALALSGCASKTDHNITVKHFSFSEKEPLSLTDISTGVLNMGESIENGHYRLSINKETLQFAVIDKKQNYVWYSSPLDDPSYSGAAEDSLRSIFTLSAWVDGSLKTFQSYTDGVKNGTYNVERDKNSFKIELSVGKTHEITSLDLPQAVEKKRFEDEILAKLSDDDREMLEKRYTLFSMSDPEISDRKKQAELEKYPTLEKNDLYTINNAVPDYVAQKIKNALDGIGYGNDEIIKDNKENGVDTEPQEALLFDVTVILTITENGFDITADCEKLCDEDMPVSDISLLPYFGASFLSDDKGFLLLPDGCGSIVDINGATAEYPNYSVKLYGRDVTVNRSQIDTVPEAAILPIFGMSKNNAGFCCVITEGDALASINMKLKETQRISSVYSSFEIAATADVDLGYTGTASGSMVTMTQPIPYTGRLSVSYLMKSENITLGSMSQSVRSFLQNKGDIPKEKHANESRLRLDVIGAIEKKSSILGIIPTSKSVAVTDFEQATDIVTSLSRSGNGKIELIYNGWCNGGIYTKSVNNITVEKVLGGEKGLNKLQNRLAEKGNLLTLNVSLLQVYNTKGFSKAKNSARALGNTVSQLRKYDIATGNMFDYRIGTYIAPSAFNDYSGKFFRQLDRLTNAAVQIDDCGALLYSDMNRSNGNTRVDTAETIKNVLSGRNNLTISTGNAYVLPSASYISNIPLDSSRYKREAYAVPFVQMVLHGYIGYSSGAVNLSGDWREEVLRAASFGADVTFAVGMQNEEFYYDTYYPELTSTEFEEWEDIISDTYERLYGLFNLRGHAELCDYRIVGDGVFASVYDNGVNVISNYNTKEVYTEYGAIKAQDWIVVKGGES